jgi:hypothetical protein
MAGRPPCGALPVGVLKVALMALALGAADAGVAEPYAHPTLAIPYAREKPTIDGVVGDAEWQAAASFNALQKVGKKLAAR